MRNFKKGSWAMKTAAKYLFLSLFVAVFGAVYEAFSFGVYSYFMIYAFMWPMVLGTFPFLWMALVEWQRGSQAEDSQKDGTKAEALQLIRRKYRFWHAGVLVLTVGSVFHGILVIYGTTSPYDKWFFAAGMVLLLVAMIQNGRSTRIKNESA